MCWCCRRRLRVQSSPKPLWTVLWRSCTCERTCQIPKSLHVLPSPALRTARGACGRRYGAGAALILHAFSYDKFNDPVHTWRAVSGKLAYPDCDVLLQLASLFLTLVHGTLAFFQHYMVACDITGPCSFWVRSRPATAKAPLHVQANPLPVSHARDNYPTCKQAPCLGHKQKGIPHTLAGPQATLCARQSHLHPMQASGTPGKQHALHTHTLKHLADCKLHA